MKGVFIERDLNKHRVTRVEMNDEYAYLSFEDDMRPSALTIKITDRIKKAFQDEDWDFFDSLGKKTNSRRQR